MRIFNMTVSGDLTLNMKFEEKNVLLGENNKYITDALKKINVDPKQ